MYGKIFASLYQGTLRGRSHEILVFTNLIASADAAGHVDKHFRAIAEEVGITVEEVKAAILVLESPDPESRSPEAAGARLLRIDEHRSWGWRITNHAKYRAIRNEEDRREQNRLAQERFRNKSKPRKPMSAQAEAEAEAEAEDKTPIPPEGDKKVILPKKGPLQRRAESMFGRREETPLTAGEVRAFKNSKAAMEATTEADWLDLEKFYAAPQTITYARKDLATLVNNWNGEIDRAKHWIKNPNGNHPSNNQRPDRAAGTLNEGRAALYRGIKSKG